MKGGETDNQSRINTIHNIKIQCIQIVCLLSVDRSTTVYVQQPSIYTYIHPAHDQDVCIK